MAVLAGRGPRAPTDGTHTHAPSDRTRAPSDRRTRTPAGDDDSDGAPSCLHQLTKCLEQIGCCCRGNICVLSLL